MNKTVTGMGFIGFSRASVPGYQANIRFNTGWALVGPWCPTRKVAKEEAEKMAASMGINIEWKNLRAA